MRLAVVVERWLKCRRPEETANYFRKGLETGRLAQGLESMS